ncbi:unnamed protein product [Didymodactylos carnosus]|uniref:Uncharacterized protein n=1 Tax=Didymodactylos carnosus TaxID=1234261 RepID=A0A815FJ05_9BILA|nr:unnamed protein product [Didymodactylos carnosus]CAF1326030.1 unnamed protein product [Didymodactylos carnosus]CAF4175743.1 unnamed protein product [Didymodactylos carnosus]CAF4175762.1 unnamed protein product [Didymodactylos carnosus]
MKVSHVNTIVTATENGGNFGDRSTWVNGLVPGSGCIVVIPFGSIVTFTVAGLNVKVLRFIIEGTLVFPASFTFSFSISIILYGICRGSTTLTFGTNSALYIYSGGSFQGSTINCLTNQYSIGTRNGPFTVTIDTSGKIASYKIAESGQFDSPQSWCGGYLPTPSACPVCDLMIPPAFTLNTGSLTTLLINFGNMYIFGGFTVGVSGVAFRFSSACSFYVHETGIFQDGTNGLGLYFFFKSYIILSPGGKLSKTTIYTYGTNGAAGVTEQYTSDSIGPFSYEISASGTITTYNSVITVSTTPAQPGQVSSSTTNQCFALSTPCSTGDQCCSGQCEQACNHDEEGSCPKTCQITSTKGTSETRFTIFIL